MSPAAPSPTDGIREETAMLFAGGDLDEAINYLLGYLDKNAKSSPPTLWLMLMELYQARSDQPSFERLAAIYAQRFDRSPPSWTPRGAVAAPRLVRNVLVLDGAPSQVSPSKWRDFLASARDAGFCRLDLSRLRLPDGQDQFDIEADALLDLMGRLTRYHTRVMLMGDGALIERLERDLSQWPVGPARKAAIRLLLTLLQWRGRPGPFETWAMRFADEFETSPPGYETLNELAQEDPEPIAAIAERVLDETTIGPWCEALGRRYQASGQADADFQVIDRITFPAALALANFLDRAGLDPRRLVFRHVNELQQAIFDHAGVSGQVTYGPRRR